jgi:hypothetical protein
MDLTVINRHSPGRLGFSTVVFSCLGGVELGRGIQQLIRVESAGIWIVSFLCGSAFLGYGIFWAVMLARRAHSATMTSQL